MKKNIALIAGGNSSERDISLLSARQVMSALDTSKYDIYLIDLHHSSWTCFGHEIDKTDFSLSISDEKIIFDFALIMIHGIPGEDGKLQGYLDMIQVPYSSCSHLSSVITFDKMLCKSVVRAHGLNLAKELVLKKGETFDFESVVDALALPFFVKPNASGSSFGVSKVGCKQQYSDALELAFKEGDTVLMEEFISGREFGCGLMINSENEYIFPVAEIISERDFFDYTAKYEGKSQEVVPAEISEELSDKIKAEAKKAYLACGCSGIVRIDFIVRDELPYMIEINSIPGMSPESIIPKQLRAYGKTIGEIYDEIISNKI